MNRKRLVVSLGLVVGSILMTPDGSVAGGNHCNGPVDTHCHQGHDEYGYPTGFCTVYIDLGEPTNDYCVKTY